MRRRRKPPQDGLPHVWWSGDEATLLVLLVSNLDPANYKTASARAVIEKAKAAAEHSTVRMFWPDEVYNPS